MNLFAQFANIITAIKTGDYKGAACSAGRIITTVTCATPAELLATAKPQPEIDHESGIDPNRAPYPAPNVATPVELYETCAAFTDELAGACEHSETVCRMGAASDAEVAPGNWDAIKALIIDVLRRFIKRPADWQPAPLPVPAAVGVITPTLDEISKLPNISKPSDRKPDAVPATPEPAEPESGDEPTDGEPETEPETTEPTKPKGKRKPK